MAARRRKKNRWEMMRDNSAVEANDRPGAAAPMGQAHRPDWRHLILLLAIIAYTAWFTHLSHLRWSLMLSSSGDLGHIDSAAYNTAHGAFMLSTGARVQNMWADHFSPILLILSAFYLFSDSFWFIYFWQAVSVALAAVPLYLIARPRLGENPALLCALGYLLNARMQSATLFDYHEAAHVGLFALAAIYMAERRRWPLFALFGALLLSCREDSALILFSIGVYIIIIQRDWRHGGLACAAAAIYFISLMKVVFPYLRSGGERGGGEEYMYFASYAWLGATPWQAVANMLSDPVTYASMIFHPVRIAAWKELAGQYLYLDFLSPSGLLLMAFPSLSLLLNNHEQRYGLELHYPMLAAPFWALGFILGAANLGRLLAYTGVGAIAPWDRKRFLGPASILFALVALAYGLSLSAYLFHGPFDFRWNGLRVYLDDPGKPLLIFMASLFFAMALAPVRFPPGNDILGRALFLVTLYSAFVSGYYSIIGGATPFMAAGDHARYYDQNLAHHSARVSKALATLPRHASAAIGQGPYTLALHNPNTALFRGFSGYPFGQERKVDYIVFDLDSPAEEPMLMEDLRPQVFALLLRERGYGVILRDGGILILKKDAPSAANYDALMEAAGVFGVGRSMGMGNLVADPSLQDGAVRLAKAGVHERGYIAYGPWIKLYNGEHTAHFQLKTGARVEGALARVEVAADSGQHILAQKTLTWDDFGNGGEWKEFALPFTIEEEAMGNVELRVEYMGRADIYFHQSRISMSPQSYDQAYLAAMKVDGPLIRPAEGDPRP